MTSKKNKPFPSNPKIVTPRYRGPDRRDSTADEDDVEPVGSVSFDVKGNSVWQPRVDARRRRKDDDTVNTLKRLDLESLSIQDEGLLQGEESTKPVDGHDPYNSDDKSLETKKRDTGRGS